jgi:hypothetical protein
MSDATLIKGLEGGQLCKKSRPSLHFFMFSRKKFVSLRKHTSCVQGHHALCGPLAVIIYPSPCLYLDRLHPILLVVIVQRFGKDESTFRIFGPGCVRVWHSAELTMSSGCYEQTAGISGAASHCLGTSGGGRSLKHHRPEQRGLQPALNGPPSHMRDVIGSENDHAIFSSIGCMT